MKNNTFTVNDTNICKGIAILFMVMHHVVGLYYNKFNPSWYFENSKGVIDLILLIFGSSGKVCVSLFTILSGFGVAKSYEKSSRDMSKISNNFRFSLSHIIQFYSIWWVIFVINLFFTFHSPSEMIDYYAPSGSLCFGFFTHFFGIHNLFGLKYNDWYITAILIFYILFPIMYKLTKKINYWMLPITFIPYLIFMFTPVFSHFGVGRDSFWFYLLSFELGIILAKNNLLNRLKDLICGKSKIFIALSFLILIITWSLRLIFSVYCDVLFAVSIIVFEIVVISKLNYLSKVLMFFGINSANIWLFHAVFLSKFDFNNAIRFLIIFSVSLVVSVVIEKIKEITGYKTAVKKIRKLIC